MKHYPLTDAEHAALCEEERAGRDLEGRIAALFAARGSMSASDVTKALSESGGLPPYWSVIDVADFLREWFSSQEPRR